MYQETYEENKKKHYELWDCLLKAVEERPEIFYSEFDIDLLNISMGKEHILKEMGFGPYDIEGDCFACEEFLDNDASYEKQCNGCPLNDDNLCMNGHGKCFTLLCRNLSMKKDKDEIKRCIIAIRDGWAD